MSENYDIRKLGGDKIALLALFVISLLTARLVVGLKSALVLSEPIPLPNTGLSVSMPTGNGWHSRTQWAYDEDARILSSSFSVGPGEPTARVICRYKKDADKITPQMRFEQQAQKFDGQIVEINELRTETLIFEWAHIKGREALDTVFLGTTILPDGRQLDVEVYEVTGDTSQAEQAFKRVVESVNFTDAQQQTAALSKT